MIGISFINRGKQYFVGVFRRKTHVLSLITADYERNNLRISVTATATVLYVLVTLSSVPASDEWNENDHPRDKSGRFGKGGGESNKGKEKMIKTEDLLGKEYTGVKGKDAIDKLMQEKQGFVRDAFSRKDIGDIALIWGNDGMGLAHIIKRRKKTKQPLGKLLSSLPEIIKNGALEEQANGRFGIRYKGKVAVIEPKLLGNGISFLFTSFYEQ